MLSNYFKIAVRTLRKHRLYAFINIFGLALGVACCILIYSFIRHEWSYDRFHQQHDDIFRIIQVTKAPDGEADFFTHQPVPLGPVLEAEFPEIRQVIRFINSNGIISIDGESFGETLTYVDREVFEVFSFPFIAGNAAAAFSSANGIVLTKEYAEKFFGRTDVVGKSLSIRIQSETKLFTVTGVLESLPENSTIRFSALMPYEMYPFYDNYVDNWSSSRSETYLLLNDAVDKRALEAKFPPIISRHLGDRIAQSRAEGELSLAEDAWMLTLQPLTAVHVGFSQPGDIAESRSGYTLILAGIGGLILLLACINFLTLSLGRSTTRAAEVGVRKVLGAARKELIKQFMGEAMLMSLLGLAGGIALAELFLPSFSALADKKLTITYRNDIATWLILLGLLIIMALLAGSYPSLVISRFKPIEILRGKLSLLKGSQRTRGAGGVTRSLVLLQYAMSILLIVCTLVMVKQMRFLQKKDLGHTKDPVLVIKTYTAWGSGEGQMLLDRARTRFLENRNVRGVTGTAFSFAKGTNSEGWRSGETNRSAYVYRVAPDYVPTLGIELVAGRNFSADFPSDRTSSVIVNEALVRQFGLGSPEEALGQTLLGYQDGQGLSDPAIIGVARDYHFRSLHNEIEPAFLHISSSWPIWNILVRMAPGQISETLDYLRNSWSEIAPGKPFEFTFMDDDINLQYHNEQRWETIVRYSAILALVIASLGLFGLAAAAAARRTKEIGIRKVLGATAPGIAAMLCREFLLLVGLACFVSFPVAYWASRKWLDNFAYSTGIGPDVFLLAGTLAIMLAIMTVLYQSLKAALANPVESLRYE